MLNEQIKNRRVKNVGISGELSCFNNWAGKQILDFSLS